MNCATASKLGDTLTCIDPYTMIAIHQENCMAMGPIQLVATSVDKIHTAHLTVGRVCRSVVDESRLVSRVRAIDIQRSIQAVNIATPAMF